jgi:hypothetical protein
VGTSARLTFRGGQDGESGLAGYVITEGDGAAPPEGCLRAPMVQFGKEVSGTISLDDLEPGSRHFYRLCMSDKVGNQSPGLVATVSIAADARADSAGSAADDGSGGGFGCGAASTGLAGLLALAIRRRKQGLSR